jgi:hypothetical protein
MTWIYLELGRAGALPLGLLLTSRTSRSGLGLVAAVADMTR